IKPLFDEIAISNKITDMAMTLNHDCLGTKNIVLICILKGSFIFAADLIRKLNFDFEIEFIEISSYGNKIESGKVQLISEIKINLTDKNIFIIEDIIDTGNTLNFLELKLQEKGAKNINYITLLLKHEKHQTKSPIKYFGFKINDVFVAGYGMDYKGKYRNLPCIIDVNDIQSDLTASLNFSD
ncbi:MAG: hypoxanthine phosphoribosyltransferase, partial [Spirochaetia bacterium]|nr:hypoxanthine phosphoribosyltransferase [Spirochaetia bacterium]